MMVWRIANMPVKGLFYTNPSSKRMICHFSVTKTWFSMRHFSSPSILNPYFFLPIEGKVLKQKKKHTKRQTIDNFSLCRKSAHEKNPPCGRNRWTDSPKSRLQKYKNEAFFSCIQTCMNLTWSVSKTSAKEFFGESGKKVGAPDLFGSPSLSRLLISTIYTMLINSI